MMGWDHGYGWMGFGGPFVLLLWIAVIVGVVALIRWVLMRGDRGQDLSRRTPLDILKERYARGDITREEYEQMRQDLAR